MSENLSEFGFIEEKVGNFCENNAKIDHFGPLLLNKRCSYRFQTLELVFTEEKFVAGMKHRKTIEFNHY